LKVFEKFYPNERFKDYSPSYYNREMLIDLRAVEKEDNELEKYLKSRRLDGFHFIRSQESHGIVCELKSMVRTVAKRDKEEKSRGA
jgi:hypothetical protein